MDCDSPKGTHTAGLAAATPPSTGQRRRTRVDELELALEEANTARRQLELALATAAEELEATHARVEELLPLGLDKEPAPGVGGPALDPVDEPTVLSDDNSDTEVPTPAQQWSFLSWSNFKATAQAKIKAAKEAARAAGKKQDPATDWNLETFRRVETTTKSRRGVPITSQAPATKPFRKGKEGPIQHERQGLAGAVQFWACGLRSNVVVLLMKLIRHFGVEESIREQLGRKETRDAETYAYMITRAREFIAACKSCSTAEQHRQYLFGLGIFAPPHGDPRDPESMANRVARVLDVKPGRRTKRSGEELGRPRAFYRAQDLRAAFDIRLAELYVPMNIGDQVLCRGQLARLTSFDSATGRCTVAFNYEGVEERVPYTSRYGRGPGSARLQRPPALLLPSPRERVKGTITLEIFEHVREIFELTCPTSPHQKDKRKRRLGRHVFQTLQAMIQTLPLDEIYRVFQKTYPLDKLGWTQFRILKPWNLIKAYRETCLCRCCELFRLYVQALNIVGGLLEPLVCHTTSLLCQLACSKYTAGHTHSVSITWQVNRDDHSDDAEEEGGELEAAAIRGEAKDADLVWLVDFCTAGTKSEMANKLVRC